MIDKLLKFIDRHDSFILTTHDPADADGIGTQMVMACILRGRGKRFRIINASPVPEHFVFMDSSGIIEELDRDGHGVLPERSALIIVDTAEENHMGQMRELIGRSREVFVIDHHEPKPDATLKGIYDVTAASTCELVVELAEAAGTVIDPDAAFAAYVGIAYDTGFFAFPKVGPRTFRAALELVRLGANPSEAYRQLCENVPARALLLQKKAFAGLTLHCGNRVALQVLRREDFSEVGAQSGDTDGFVNFPLKTRDIRISFLIKETPEGKVCGSLRSKGDLNVAKIARELGGGGHINASGFRSTLGLDETIAKTLAKITEYMEAQ
ncbi:MAG: bifunctional oligoribonuclease/PAP phosphatase NrnA [Treponema sp.]|nr:bifunctional oligoribonuclease/PAP phosphatase NrnA [Treponema sp.]